MEKPYYFLFPFVLASLAASGQSLCTQTVDSDNYSNASAWTAAGAGNVTVTGGACTWNGAQCGSYDRIYRPLAATLSDTYFKAEFKFTVQQNPAGQGGGSNLISFSAGTLDPLSYDNSQSFATTNQDGFIVLIGSSSTSDNNINNWTLAVCSKDGTTNTVGANSIALSSSILTYYAVFERTTTQTFLSLYSDAAHTQLVGSAANPTSAAVTGLTHVHHGVTTWGWTTRHFNGTVDDLVICDDGAASSCTTMHSDNYSSSAAWTASGAGNVTVTGGTCTWNGAQCGSYDRICRPLAATLSDTYFKAEFKFTVQQNPAGQGGGSNLISFSAGTLDPLSYDNSQSFATTNQDGFIVLIGSPSTSDNNINNWTLAVCSKDGNTNTVGSNQVSLSSSILTYYAVFERTTTQTLLSLYSDAAHTQLVGSAANPASAAVTGLTHVHHGVTTWGWTTRHFNGTLDDLVICDDITGIIPVEAAADGFTIFPNPSAGGHITINFGEHHPENVYVYDALGQLVSSCAIAAGAANAELSLPRGFYLLVIEENGQRYSHRQVVE